MTQSNEAEFRQRMQRVENLVERIEALADPAARNLSRQLTESLLDLHATGLRQMLKLLSKAEDERLAIPDRWLEDPLISNLLILHDLHPVEATDRIRQALEDVKQQALQQGVTLELMELGSDFVQIRVEGGGGGCPSSRQKLRRLIDDAFCGAAPDRVLKIAGLDSSESLSEYDSLLPILRD